MSDTFRDYSHTQRIPKAGGNAGASRSDGSFHYSIPSASSHGNAGANASRSRASSGNKAKSGSRGSVAKNAGTRELEFPSAVTHRRPSADAYSYRDGSRSDNRRGGSSSGGSHGSRSGSAAKRRKKKQERAIAIGFLFLVLLLGTTILVVVRSCRPSEPVVLDPATDTFRDGVSIDGFSVTGMTIDQARTVIEPAIDQKIASICITLAGEGFSETITGEQMNASSDLEQILSNALIGGENGNYATKLSLDYTALASRISEINASLSYGATDATFTLEVNDKGKPQLNYIEGRAGMGLDVQATQALVQQALEAGNYTATITPALTTVQPNVTVADLKSQISEIGRFSTEYGTKLPSDRSEEDRMVIQNRAFNIDKCAALINGQVIQPGSTWSFNKTVGDRNEKNGWKQAKGIYGGEAYTMQYGGGVCQVSTTLYGALLRAGLPFEEFTRREHSIPSTYVPLGLDATVDSGHIDFKFKNTTEYPLYIFAYTSVNKNRTRYSYLTVVVYGQALPEGVTYEPRSVTVETIEPGEPIITYDKKQTTDYNVVTVEARDGYVVDVYLDKFVNGKLESSQLLYEDRYEPKTEKRTIGTLSPVTEMPGVLVTPAPNTDELP